MRKRVWLTHNRREDWQHCPMCQQPIRWVYDGINWIPCDREPVMYKWDLGGRFYIVRNRELVKGCEIYAGGGSAGYRMGFLPHVHSCDHLNGWEGAKYDR